MNFLLPLLAKLLTDPKVREFLIQIITDDRVQQKLKDLLGGLITERIMPLLPVSVAAAVKSAVDGIVEKVPALEGVVDVVQVADDSRNALNELIPDIDVGIPALDNLLDFWRPKG